MQNTSKISLTSITDEVVIKLLTVVLPVLKTAGIDYFAIGAFARDVKMLDKGHTDPPTRKTKDVDLSVMVGSLDEYEKLKEAICKLPNFEPDAELPYRLIFQNAYDLDLLPFGEIENEKGQVELLEKNVFTLDMPGLGLVQPFAEKIETQEGLTLNVSSLSGIVLLKLIAWQDNPSREKDIQDIAHILQNFMSLHLEEIGGVHIMDLYEGESNQIFDQLVSARYIGRQMGIMLQKNADLTKRVRLLLEEESKKSGMARLMPQVYIEDNQRVITALLEGIHDIDASS